MTLLFLPIERYDSRYSAQWYHWFMKELSGKDVVVVGDTELREIKTGQFLDAFETMRYKADQTKAVVEWLRDNPETPCTIFCMDLWHPGIVSMAYAAKVGNREATITGILHAGTWDEYDHLTAVGLRDELAGFEDSIFNIARRIYVGTHFHAELLRADNCRSKIQVVDFPVIEPIMGVPFANRERLVVWPHRKAPEKQPEVWDEIVALYRQAYPEDRARFVTTVDECSTKTDYYDLLARARVVVSTALQETFGIAMLEGLNSGAWPVVPDSLSYRELYSRASRYLDVARVPAMIHARLNRAYGPTIDSQYVPDLSWIGAL